MPFDITFPIDGETKFGRRCFIATGRKNNNTNTLVYGLVHDSAGKVVCAGTLISPVNSYVWTMQFHIPMRALRGRSYFLRAFEMEPPTTVATKTSSVLATLRFVLERQEESKESAAKRSDVRDQRGLDASSTGDAGSLSKPKLVGSIDGLFSVAKDRPFPIYGTHESSSPSTLKCTAISRDDYAETEITAQDTVNDPVAEFCFTFPVGLPYKTTGLYDIEVTNLDTNLVSELQVRP